MCLNKYIYIYIYIWQRKRQEISQAKRSVDLMSQAVKELVPVAAKLAADISFANSVQSNNQKDEQDVKTRKQTIHDIVNGVLQESVENSMDVSNFYLVLKKCVLMYDLACCSYFGIPLVQHFKHSYRACINYGEMLNLSYVCL